MKFLFNFNGCCLTRQNYTKDKMKLNVNNQLRFIQNGKQVCES